MNEFAFKQHAVSIDADMDSIAATTLKNRMSVMADRITSDLTFDLIFELYGDHGEPQKLTIRQRLTRNLNLYLTRIQDAWLVLTGRAEIGDDY